MSDIETKFNFNFSFFLSKPFFYIYLSCLNFEDLKNVIMANVLKIKLQFHAIYMYIYICIKRVFIWDIKCMILI